MQSTAGADDPASAVRLDFSALAPDSLRTRGQRCGSPDAPINAGAGRATDSFSQGCRLYIFCINRRRIQSGNRRWGNKLFLFLSIPQCFAILLLVLPRMAKHYEHISYATKHRSSVVSETVTAHGLVRGAPPDRSGGSYRNQSVGAQPCRYLSAQPHCFIDNQRPNFFFQQS